MKSENCKVRNWGMIGLVAVLVGMAGASLALDVNLAWDWPTNNVDGTPLTDLAGAHVWQGASSNGPWYIVGIVTNDVPAVPGTGAVGRATVTIRRDLIAVEQVYATPTGRYARIWFVGTALNVLGNESDYSETAGTAIPVWRPMPVRFRVD